MPRSELKLRSLAAPDVKDPNVVAYTSVNSTTGTSFSAVSDPNNPHAARLARLAIAVQSKDHEESRRRAETRARSSFSLPWFSASGVLGGSTRRVLPPPAQPAPAPPPRPPPQLGYHAGTTASVGGDRSGYTCQSYPQASTPVPAPVQQRESYDVRDEVSMAYAAAASAYASTPIQYAPASGIAQQEVVYSPHSWAYSPTQSNTAPPPVTVSTHVPEANVATVEPRGAYESLPPVEVTRYQTESMTAYRIQSGVSHGELAGDSAGRRKAKNELYVSAPAGSSEAALFDEFAKMHSR
jgi:hypothetical protein